MLEKFNKYRKYRPVALISMILVFMMLIVTTAYAAFSFQKKVTDEDVIIGKITDVSKSFLSSLMPKILAIFL